MPTDQLRREQLWSAIRAERAALADDLANLTPEQWRTPSWCTRWTVREVLAHLTAAASVGRLAWLRSMAGARFRPDVHNQRRLTEQLGRTPEETLQRFRAVVDSTVAPSGHPAAWLGEVIVHGEDIRGPLRLSHTSPPATLTAVATFFAERDFAVNSRSAVKGLHLAATDGPFRAGSGPAVTGTTHDLVLAMAGRVPAYDHLTGPGVATLRERVAG